MESFTFGDNPEMADELLNLVLKGQKTATAWAAVNGTHGSEVGKRMEIKDSKGVARAIIETIELEKKPFNLVDERFAYDEGEGDRTLSHWREEHKKYFTREGTYSDDMEVYCERFKLIKILP